MATLPVAAPGGEADAPGRPLTRARVGARARVFGSPTPRRRLVTASPPPGSARGFAHGVSSLDRAAGRGRRRRALPSGSSSGRRQSGGRRPCARQGLPPDRPPAVLTERPRRFPARPAWRMSASAAVLVWRLLSPSPARRAGEEPAGCALMAWSGPRARLAHRRRRGRLARARMVPLPRDVHPSSSFVQDLLQASSPR